MAALPPKGEVHPRSCYVAQVHKVLLAQALIALANHGSADR